MIGGGTHLRLAVHAEVGTSDPPKRAPLLFRERHSSRRGGVTGLERRVRLFRCRPQKGRSSVPPGASQIESPGWGDCSPLLRERLPLSANAVPRNGLEGLFGAGSAAAPVVAGLLTEPLQGPKVSIGG